MSTDKHAPARTFLRLAIFLAKLVIAILLVGWLFSQQRFNLVLITQLHSTPETIALFSIAVVSVLVGLLIMSWRFQLLLQRVGFPITLREAIGLTFIGSFTSAVLPGLVGGDVVKTVYLCRSSTHQRSEALAAVLVDRAIGLYSLMFLAVMALPVVSLWHLTRLDQHIELLLLALWGGVTFAGVLLTICPLSPMLHLIQARLPQGLRDLLQAFVTYCASPKLLIASICLSLINHVLVVLSFWMVGLLISDPLTFFGHIVLNPLAMLLNAIPLTPGGIGLAESGFALLFEHAGSPNGATIGLLGRFIQYVVFTLCGIPALLLLNIQRKFDIDTRTTPHVEERKMV